MGRELGKHSRSAGLGRKGITVLHLGIALNPKADQKYTFAPLTPSLVVNKLIKNALLMYPQSPFTP